MIPRCLAACAFALPHMLAPTAAFAYIGPGAGISAIGSALVLIAALLLAIVGFVWYPMKRLLRSRRKAPDIGAPASGEEKTAS